MKKTSFVGWNYLFAFFFFKKKKVMYLKLHDLILHFFSFHKELFSFLSLLFFSFNFFFNSIFRSFLPNIIIKVTKLAEVHNI